MISGEHPDQQELSDVMKEIAALKGNEFQALSGSGPAEHVPAVVATQDTPPPVIGAQPAPSTPVPLTPQRPQPTPNVLGDAKVHDVVQVNDRENRYHGALFTIGGMADGWVHGYILKEQGGKDFITVKIHEVHRIGPAKVRSAVPCSRQWIEQHQQHGREK